MRHMSATSCAIARNLCNCFNSRQEMLVPGVPMARMFGAGVQMINAGQVVGVGMSTIGQHKGQAPVVLCLDADKSMTAIPAKSNENQLYIAWATTTCNEVRARM